MAGEVRIITCPHCRGTGRISDEIPPEGKSYSCPICTHPCTVFPDGSTKRIRRAKDEPAPARHIEDRHRNFLRQLEAELPSWIRSGIITSEQKEKILDRYCEISDKRPSPLKKAARRFIILTIAAIAFAALLLLIYFSFKYTDRRVVIVLLTILSFVFQLSANLMQKKKNFPASVIETIYFAGGLLFLSSVYSAFYLFNLNSIAPISLLLAACALIPSGMMFRSLALQITGLVSYLLYALCVEISGITGSIPYPTLPSLGIAGIAIFSAGSAIEWKRGKNLAIPWLFAGSLATMLSFLPYTFLSFWMHQSVSSSPLFLMFLNCAVILASVILGAGREDEYRISEPSILILFMAFFLSIHYSMINPTGYLIHLSALVINLFYMLMVLNLLNYGYARNSITLVNSSILLFIIYFISHYVSIFSSVLPDRIFYAAGGTLLIASGVLLERKREFIIEQMLR